MTAMQQPPPVGNATAPNERVRLYLSGGSNRAAFAAVGVIVYLATRNKGQTNTSYRWSEVDEVIGVSGGSQAVASLIAGLRRTQTDDDLRAVESMQAFFDAHVVNASHLKAKHRRRYILILLLLIAIPIALFALFVLISWSGLTLFSWLVPPIVPFVSGILSMPLVYGLGRLVLRRYLRSFIADVVCASAQPQPSFPPNSVVAKMKLNQYTDLARQRPPKRSYFLAVVGMSSGSNYAYFAGQGLGAADPWTVSQEQKNAKLVDACTDSCALPPLSRRSSVPPVHKPVDDGVSPAFLPEAEALLDGGYGGSFGVQIVHKVAGEIAHHGSAGNVANSGSVHPNSRRIIAVDAGTAIGEKSDGISIIRSISTVVRLLRIVQVGNAAVYRNDLEDIEDADGGIVTVSRIHGLQPNLGTGSPQAQEIAKKLRTAVDFNGRLSLVNVDPKRAALATAIGVVGVYLADVNQRGVSPTKQELKKHLEGVGKSLNIGNALWDMWEKPEEAWS